MQYKITAVLSKIAKKMAEPTRQELAKQIAILINGSTNRFKGSPNIVFDTLGRTRSLRYTPSPNYSMEDLVYNDNRQLVTAAKQYAKAILKETDTNKYRLGGFSANLIPTADGGFDYRLHPLYNEEWDKVINPIKKAAAGTTMQLLPAQLVDSQKPESFVDPNYTNYKTLLDYATKNPLQGMSGEETANKLLAAKIAKRICDRMRTAGLDAKRGVISGGVIDNGEGLPLNDKLGGFADVVLNSYHSAPDMGANRFVFFNKNGQPIMLRNQDTGKFVTSPLLANPKGLRNQELFEHALNNTRYYINMKSDKGILSKDSLEKLKKYFPN